MKNQILSGWFTACLLLINAAPLLSQTVIGNAPPDNSAALLLQDGNKGFLLPRMTTADRDSIRLPAPGLMIYNLSNYCVEINTGSASRPEWLSTGCRRASVASLNCNALVTSGNAAAYIAVQGVSLSLSYSGGNGGAYDDLFLPSRGVTGLTAHLTAGNVSVGTGLLSFAVSGTPSAPGNALFDLEFGGETCSLLLTVADVNECGAFLAPGVWKKWMCFNLGAGSTSINPFAPAWNSVGSYWRWGNLPLSAPGPAGPTPTQTNEGNIQGWPALSVVAPDDAWSDLTKTTKDPCPDGFRLPTKENWDQLIANNPLSYTGTWIENTSNYNSGLMVGDRLFLPAAGQRGMTYGESDNRGDAACYWSSSRFEGNNLSAWSFFAENGIASTVLLSRNSGFSVRCISE